MEVTLLVEVDVALRRPPRADKRVWVWVVVDDGPHAGTTAEELACQIAAGSPGVVMPVGARVIDWVERPAVDQTSLFDRPRGPTRRVSGWCPPRGSAAGRAR